MSDEDEKLASSVLYTTEAQELKEEIEAELEVPDPPFASQAINENTIEE